MKLPLFILFAVFLIKTASSQTVITLPIKNPGSISFLAYSKKSGKLYVPCFTCHAIYTVSKDGKVELLAGTGIPGHRDGSLKEAQFDCPNSVAISDDGDLYISEFSTNRIRKITKVE